MNVQKVCLALILVRRRRRLRKRARRWWVHPIVSERRLNGRYHILHERLKNYPEKFFCYYRMSLESFEYLLELLGEELKLQNNNMRSSISAEEKLSVTLRYLATGCSFQSLHFEYLLGRSTIGYIVKDTCHLIWRTLKNIYMLEPTEEDWIRISDEFWQRTNFPNSFGAVDGKHIRIIKPSNSGSQFWNYKNYCSIVLMAVVDADYSFTFIDVGAYGKSGDSNVFKDSVFGEKLYREELALPNPKRLPNDNNGRPIPYVLVADEAFAVCKNLVRPYPNRNLGYQKRIFNYRLSRARRFVECTFGILANKWRIFHRPIDVLPDFADVIIKACCVLHNYVRKRDGIKFEDTLTCTLEDIPAIGTRGIKEGNEIRDYLAEYFSSNRGSVPWQDGKI